MAKKNGGVRGGDPLIPSENDVIASRADGDLGAGVSPPANTQPRVSLTVQPDGRAAWDRMRPATIEQLRIIASDPEFAERVGAPGIKAGAGASVPTLSVFDETATGYLFAAVARIKVSAALAAGYSPQVAAIQHYTPEESARLGKGASALLNLYVSPYVGKYPELADFVGNLLMIEFVKLMQMRQAAATESAGTSTAHVMSSDAPQSGAGVPN